jgi:hypothetical protein
MHNGFLKRWNLMNNNRRKNMKKILIISGLTISFGAFALFGFLEEDTSEVPVPSDNIEQDCEIPEFAKAIGHEDLWLKHNGCPPITSQISEESSPKMMQKEIHRTMEMESPKTP